MRAVMYEAPKTFAVVDVPTPEPGPKDVRVRVELAGICGTDVHIHDGTFFAQFPLIPGHEMVGVVDSVGESVDDLRLGDRVVVNGNSGCTECDFCAEGHPLLCRRFSALGVTAHGGFAEYVVAPAGQCVAVGDLPPDVAVLAEPAACATHGVTLVDARPGCDALVIGSGPTGLILAQLLKHNGAARVTVAAPTRFKLDVARSLGVDRVLEIPKEQDAARDLLRAAAPDGYDVVVDATGAAAVAEMTVALARDGGIVLWYGVTNPDDRVSISPYDIYRREITIRGSFAQVHSFRSAVRSIVNERVRTDNMITHRFGLDDFGAAIEAVRSDASCLKAVIDPRLS